MTIIIVFLLAIIEKYWDALGENDLMVNVPTFLNNISNHFMSSRCPQVFVANPNKPKPILDILLRNQDLLVEFLTRFHTDRSEDEQFNDEKAYLIKQIKELKPIAGDNQ